MATQGECKQDFIKLLEDTFRRIELIDKCTPAEPTGSMIPPMWWDDMVMLQREIARLKLKHTPKESTK